MKKALPYPPRLYELVHRGNEGDVEFYVRASEGARSILELGSGCGRVTGALLEAGLPVVGLDIDPDFLARAEERLAPRKVEFVEADMSDFDLDRLFDRVLIPYGGVYCLLTEEAFVGCLRAARRHLAPEGRVVFDGWSADEWHAESRPEDVSDEQVDHVARVELEGVVFDVGEKSRWDRPAQRLDATYLHLPRGGGETVEATIPQRYLLSEQLEPLLEKAGLEVAALHGDSDGSPFDDESPQLIVTARHLSI